MAVKVLEQCRVSPLGFSPSITLPLTLFDIPWLQFPPGKPLFFYHYPHTTSHFTSVSLPNLKHSLSLTLQHFSPFAGTIDFPSFTQSPTKPEIVFLEGKHVSLTVAESNNGDFGNLISDCPRDIDEFHPLVPKLGKYGENHRQPLFSVQVTVFPSHGICIGIAYHHVIADGRTLDNFIKTWAGFCKDPTFTIKSKPFLDRTVIQDPRGVESTLLEDWWRCRRRAQPTRTHLENRVLATFLVGLDQMERINEWILGQCSKKSLSVPIHLSPYVLACCFIWVCLAKTRELSGRNGKSVGDHMVYFGFIAGGVHRLDYPVPITYLGNCVGFARSTATRYDLLGEDGIIAAANAIGSVIKKLDKDVFQRAEEWVSDWEVLLGSDHHILVSGSPKLDLYETDFGWGRPKKVENIAIDGISAISLAKSRNVVVGGIEVGLVLPKPQMEIFISVFNEELKNLC